MFQGNPFLVDMDTETDAKYRAYVGKPSSPSFNIGRASDTGPGDVGSEIINPGGGAISNPAFPAGSRVGHPGNPNANVIEVILEGSGGLQEKKERVGAFYATTVNDDEESVKIIAVKTALQGNNYITCTKIHLGHHFQLLQPSQVDFVYVHNFEIPE